VLILKDMDEHVRDQLCAYIGFQNFHLYVSNFIINYYKLGYLNQNSSISNRGREFSLHHQTYTISWGTPHLSKWTMWAIYT
jgi:hypothetical protein